MEPSASLTTSSSAAAEAVAQLEVEAKA